MKKKIASLMTLLLLLLGTNVWAQTEVTVPQASTASAKYTYKMHCAATDHGGNYINVTEGVVDGRSTEGTLLEFVSAGNENAWYIKDVATKKYLVVTSTANGTLVTLSETADCYWLQSGSFFKADGNGSANLNNNGALAVRGGTGGCSQWTLLEYVEEAQPLSWSEVKDGYTYAIVNVQPAAVGKNYYLNSTEGNLTPVDATGFTSISEWPTTAQYVAEKQADGKFAFKNVANGQYLAWRGASGGANDNKGFVDAVNTYSAWAMHESTKFSGTYWFVAKRGNGNDGSLILSNAGVWNAWGNSEVTGRDDFSNQYGFVELAAPTMPLVEFNYVLCFESYTKNVPVSGRVGQPLPAVTIPNIFNGEQPTGTIAANQESIDIELTLKDGIMPFQYFEQSSAITQWYTLKMRDNYWMKYSTTGDPFPLSATAPAENDNTRLFGFVGNPLHGFKIVSYADGYDYRYVGATTANNSVCTAIDNEADATTLFFEVNGGHKVFHVDGNAYLNAIASSSKLGVWNHTAAATDGGSTFTFAEADIAAFDLADLKAEAIAALPANIPALYSAEDIATATAAINAVTCGADDESIRAAKEAIADAKAALLKTAEGKKVAIKSLGSYSTRGADYYLTAEAAGTQMTANTELTKNGVYELTYDEDAQAYTIQAIANETYLPKTGGASTAIATTDEAANAGLYTITSTANADQRVVLTNINGNGVSDSQGGVHLDGSKKIVVWGPTGAASNWNIEAVSDEDWAAMNPTYDWAAFETLLNQVMAMSYGDALGQYADLEIDSYGDGTRISDLVGYFQADFDGKDVDYYDTDMEDMQWIVAHAQLNMPRPGSFLRIKGAASNKYISGNVDGARVPLIDNADEAVLYLNEAGQLIGTICGRGMTGTHTYAAGVAIETHTFSEAPYAKGAYLIKSNFSGSQVLVDWTDNMLNRWGTENDVRSTWYVEEVDFLPVQISAAGYATLYAPVALEIPAGVKAYTLAENGEYLTATELEGVIPANTGVILEGESGSYKFNITTGGEGESCLSGATAPVSVNGVYTLANGEEGIGFYNYTGATAYGFKAYYESAAEVKGFGISFGDVTTGISAISADGKQIIYNLAGQRLQKAQKGIYIVNGKKVLF